MAKAGKMARQVRVLVAKSDNPSVIPGTHMGEEGNDSCKPSSVPCKRVLCILSGTCMQYMCTPTDINTHRK